MKDAQEMVFVYGTLRRDASNHFRMADSRFVSEGLVRGRLYRIDWYPGIVADENAGPVVGEIFMVSAETIAALDEFEGSEYRRVKIAFELVDAAEPFTAQAWIWEWIGKTREDQRIVSGDWLAES
ncbi:MAG: gamma-glutamylcyclotransferase [Verrucomicrobia bacterium]|nr:gamma-glutamylcyclotransferase [Verrucomicrobiota bacterium]